VKNKVLIEELEILVEEVVQNKVLIEELEILVEKVKKIKCYFLE
jgi:hypothetical protein